MSRKKKSVTSRQDAKRTNTSSTPKKQAGRRLRTRPEKPSPPFNWEVSGTITQLGLAGERSLPAAGVRVQARAQSLSDATLIGEAKTDADGHFVISYPRPSGSAPVLWIGVPDGSQGFVAKSDLYYRVGPALRIDLAIPGAGHDDASEWDRIQTRLVRHLENRSIASLTPEQLSYVRHTVDLPPHQFDRALLANRIVDDVGDSASGDSAAQCAPGASEAGDPRAMRVAAIYALLQTGAESTADALIDIPAAAKQKRWEQAITEGLLGADFRKQWGAVLEWLSDAAARQHLTRSMEDERGGTRPPLRALLDTLPDNDRLSDEEALLIARTHREATPQDDSFWKTLHDGRLDDGRLAALRRTFELDALADRNLPVVRALQTLTPDSGDGSLEHLAALPLRRWLEIAATGADVEPASAQIETVARTLAERIERRYPTAALKRHLDAGTLGLDAAAATGVQRVLEQAPQIDIRRADLEPTLRDLGIETDPATRESLLGMQRLLRLGASIGEAAILLRRDFGDSGRIAQYDPAAFVEHVQGELPAERALAIHATAQQHALAMVAAAAMVLPAFQSTPYAAMGVSSTSSAATSAAVQTFPSLQALFGDLSYCECKHCNSVLSPAAYLVDLLRMLSTQGGEYALRQRRPDLAELWLTCENTHTELPYIDLVLETLENAVTYPWPRVFLSAAEMAQLDAATLPQTVRVELQKSAREILGDVSVETRPASPKLPAEGAVIRFRHQRVLWFGRRWRQELSASARDGSGGLATLSVAEADRATWLTALRAGQVPQALAAGMAPEPRVPIFGTPTVQVVAAPPAGTLGEESWRVTITRSVVVEVVLGGSIGVLRFLDRAGVQIDAVQVQPGVLAQAVAIELNQGRVNAYLATYLPAVAYRVTADAVARRWILVAEIAVDVSMRPDSLLLEGLVYNSSSPDRDLTLQPEYRNPEAYRQLATQIYPFDLPFDVFLKEIRACARVLGTPRLDLLRRVRSDPLLQYATVSEAAETFDSTVTELGVLVESNLTAARAAAMWGLTETGNAITDPFGDQSAAPVPTDWLGALGRLSVLLDRTGLEPARLRAILAMRYLSRLTPVPNFDPPFECKPSRVTVRNLTREHLVRLLHVLRLMRMTGWTVRDLDAALGALVDPGATALSSDAQVIALAGMLAIARRTEATPRTVALWLGAPEVWAYTDHAVDGAPVRRSFYDEVFRAPGLDRLPDPDLTLSDDGTELRYLAVQPVANRVYRTLTEKRSAILAALQLSPADFADLVGAAAHHLVADQLTFANLRALWQHVSLARALRLSVQDLRLMQTAVGWTAMGALAAAPVPTGRPKRLLELLDRIDQVRASAFSLDEVAWLIGQPRLDTRLDDERGQARLQWLRELIAQQSELRPVPASEVPETVLRELLATAGWPAGLVDRVMGHAAGPFGLATPVRISVTFGSPAAPALPVGTPFSVTPAGPNQYSIELLGPFADVATADAAFAQLAQVPGLGPLTQVSAPAAQLRAQWQGLQTSLQALSRLLQSIDLPRVSTALRFAVDEPLNLVGGLQLPDSLASRVEFVPGAPLVVSGFLNASQAAALEAAISGASNAPAIGAQIARLVGPPVALAQPDSALGYDAAARSLTLRGYPLASELLAYEGLHAALEFAVAVRALGALSAAYRERRPGQRLLSESEVSALYVPARNPLERFALVQAALLRPMRRQRTLRLAAQRAGLDVSLLESLDTIAQLEVPSRDVFAPLTRDTLAASGWVGRADDPAVAAAMAAMDLIERCGLVCQRLGIQAAQRDWFDAASGFDGLRWLGLVELANATVIARFEDLRAAMELAVVRRRLADSNTAVERVRQATLESLDAALRAIEALFSLSSGSLAAVLAVEGRIQAARPLRDPMVLDQVIAIAETLSRLRISAPALVALTRTTFDESNATVARAAVIGRFGAASADDALRTAMDSLRERQRSALVSYLRHRDGARSPSELHGRYLLDVDMGAAMRTTRIKQAISAAQLFTQRWLMNLESGVASAGLAASWSWLKSYRMWEANRKVFLYPENWLEPSLRDNKSHLFRKLESEVLQSDLSTERAVRLFQDYLTDLGDLSRLTVRAMYKEQTPDGLSRVHVVARTPDQPYRFYYRQWHLTAASATWTPWEPVPTVPSTAHLVCFVQRGQPHIAWLQISRAGDDRATLGSAAQWSVEFAWTLRNNDGWTPPRKWREALLVPMLVNKSEAVSFALRVLEQNSIPRIAVYAAEDIAGPPVTVSPWPLGVFVNPGTARRVWNLSVQDLRVQVASVLSTASQTLYLALDSARVEVWGSRELDTRHEGVGTAGWKDWATASQPIQMAVQAGTAVTTLLTPMPTLVVRRASAWLYVRITVAGQLPKLFGPIEFDPRYDNEIRIAEQFPQALDDPRFLADRQIRMKMVTEFTWGRALGVESVPSPGRPELISEFNSTTHESSGSREGAAAALWWKGELLARPVSLLQRFFALASGGTGRTELDEPLYLEEAGRSALFYRDSQGRWQVLPASEFLHQGAREALALAPVDQVQIGSQDVQSARLQYLSELSPQVTQNSAGALAEFSSPWPYSLYSWEVGFHIPMLVAHAFATQQKHAESIKWLHLIFDPTRPMPSTVPGTVGMNYWQFPPFADAGAGISIDDLLTDFSRGQLSSTQSEALRSQIEFSRTQPFRPHGISRMRPRAYQWMTVLKYLDVLIAWGDQAFARDTIESINEATQLYLLAADLIGRRPTSMPGGRQMLTTPSYAGLDGKWDGFSNAWVSLGDLPFFRAWLEFLEQLMRMGPVGPSVNNPQIAELRKLLSLGSLVFCIPPNDRITEYWDTIADRLYKIRNSQNIEGVSRRLPMFEPPIDPALLVRAVAAGLDLSQLMNEAFAPPSKYRFPVVLQRALELCNEVKGLGAAVLAAAEKHEAEELTALRSGHEVALLDRMSDLKRQQRDLADAELQSARQSRQSAELRYRHYQRLLGKDDIQVPAEQERALLEQSRLRLAGAGDSVDSALRGYGLSLEEADQMRWLAAGNSYSLIGNGLMVAAGVAHAFPQITVGGPDPAPKATYGGQNIGLALNAIGQAAQMLAANASFQGNRSGMIAGHQRRYDEWILQSNLAARELAQIDRQILAAEIRVDLANKELQQHERQRSNASDIDAFLREKFTNTELYEWMSDRLNEVHRSAYQLAYQYARRTEQSLAFELGVTRPGVIRIGAWEDARKGLMSGERLAMDLRRLEAMFLDRNVRELEITKHVSLSQLNPLALARLRATGRCEFEVPEELFDLDFPGHYFRRIRSISVSLPCVVGPYSSVSGTLTLLGNRMRAKMAGTSHEYTGIDDPNFVHQLVPVQSIATSSGQNDAGLFEFDFRDERYLPFEGAGAISRWRFELPAEFRAFDYASVSDLILHVRYTARDGGEALRARAASHVRRTLAQQAQLASDEHRLARAFSVMHEYPTAWARLAAGPMGTAQMIAIDPARLPQFMAGYSVAIWKMAIVIVPAAGSVLAGDWVEVRPPRDAWTPTTGTMPVLPLGRVVESAQLIVEEFDFHHRSGGGAWTDWRSPSIQADESHAAWQLALCRQADDFADLAIVVWFQVGA